MTRQLFLLMAGALALFFGVSMLIAPHQVLANMARDADDAGFVMQWMGVSLVSVGVINILARKDPGSQALRAILIGNIVLHILAAGIDVLHHSIGFVQTSGVAMGGLVHGLLTAGFAYYLATLPPSAMSRPHVADGSAQSLG